ncbi:MAG: hypothetical protein KJO07_01395 [Deltaproteobacteria bacterium]|nr:hypothetical protein [Deltaproteobacteria bacterium]
MRKTTTRIFPALLALALAFGFSSTAAAQHRGPSKTKYKTAKTAALRIGASNMTRTPKVKNKLGTVTARRVKHDGVISKKGAFEKHQVSTRKGNGAGQPAATTVVTVRKLKDGGYKAYHAKNAKLNQPKQTRRSGGSESSARQNRRSGGSESGARRTRRSGGGE